ncbi:MAG TPA: hypothetical protein VFP66_02265 [Candidatus Limnocylindrales bacterium]|nr:hypothetical protein [Candidatus Limnocylindrales bacterium]
MAAGSSMPLEVSSPWATAHSEHEHGAEPDDDRDIEQDRTDEAWVIARLLIPREELCRPAVQAERDEHLAHTRDGERQSERSELGLAEMPGDQRLADEVDPDRDHPADEQECRPPDVGSASVTPQDPGDTLRSRSR